jgi:sugar lactone lactonase YvrE
LRWMARAASSWRTSSISDCASDPAQDHSRRRREHVLRHFAGRFRGVAIDADGCVVVCTGDQTVAKIAGCSAAMAFRGPFRLLLVCRSRTTASSEQEYNFRFSFVYNFAIDSTG